MELLFLIPLYMIFKNVKGPIGKHMVASCLDIYYRKLDQPRLFLATGDGLCSYVVFYRYRLQKPEPNFQSASNSILLVILAFTLTITHTVTSVVALLALFGLTLLWRKKGLCQHTIICHSDWCMGNLWRCLYGQNVSTYVLGASL